MVENSLTAIIVEDNIKGARLLAHIINTHCNTIQLLDVAHDVPSAVALINQKKPKLLFLDVIIHNSTCFDLLDQIEYEDVKIVIVSAYDDYAIQAFKYRAVDYVLKPVDIETFINITERIYLESFKETYSLKSQMDVIGDIIKKANRVDFIAISSLNDIIFVKHDEILYLESAGAYTTFFLIDGSSQVATKNIGEYENLLIPYNFFRNHKKYIINFKYVKSIDKRDGGICYLTSGTQLPIAFRRREELLRLINIK